MHGMLGKLCTLYTRVSCIQQMHSLSYFAFADLGVYKRPFTHLMRSNVIPPKCTQYITNHEHDKSLFNGSFPCVAIISILPVTDFSVSSH